MVIEKQSNNCVNHNKNKNNNRKIEIKNLIIPPGFYYINTMNKNFKKWKRRKVNYQTIYVIVHMLKHQDIEKLISL